MRRSGSENHQQNNAVSIKMTGSGMSHHQPVVPNSFAGAIIQGCEPSHPRNTAMVDPNDMVIPKGLNKRMSWNRDAPNS